jgi:hypothetical protein
MGGVIILAWWLVIEGIEDERIDRPPATGWQSISIFEPVYIWFGDDMPQLQPTTIFERLTQTGASRASARTLEGSDARPRPPDLRASKRPP